MVRPLSHTHTLYLPALSLPRPMSDALAPSVPLLGLRAPRLAPSSIDTHAHRYIDAPDEMLGAHVRPSCEAARTLERSHLLAGQASSTAHQTPCRPTPCPVPCPVSLRAYVRHGPNFAPLVHRPRSTKPRNPSTCCRAASLRARTCGVASSPHTAAPCCDVIPCRMSSALDPACVRSGEALRARATDEPWTARMSPPPPPLSPPPPTALPNRRPRTLDLGQSSPRVEPSQSIHSYSSPTDLCRSL